MSQPTFFWDGDNYYSICIVFWDFFFFFFNLLKEMKLKKEENVCGCVEPSVLIIDMTTQIRVDLNGDKIKDKDG